MDETERDNSGRGWLTIVALLLIPVVYLAALGPFSGLETHGYISYEFYEAVVVTAYYPVVLLDDTNFFDSHPLGRAYATYIQWFD